MNKFENIKDLEALAKMTKWCSYRDRCESEAIIKIKSLKLITNDEKNILKYLLSNNYINDLRFAKSFARGKFSTNKWGKIKIKAMLSKHRISSDIINKSLENIDAEKYLITIRKLADTKIKSFKSDDSAQEKNQKLMRFLLSKGFSHQEIKGALKKP